MRLAFLLGLLLAADARAQLQMAPDGSWVQGTPQIAPDGSWVGGRPVLAPDGRWVGTGSSGPRPGRDRRETDDIPAHQHGYPDELDRR